MVDVAVKNLMNFLINLTHNAKTRFMLYLNLANIFSYRIQTPDKRFLKLVTGSIQFVNTYEEGTDFETLVSKNGWWINFKEKGTNLTIEHYEHPSQTFLMTTKPYNGDWKQNYKINQVPNKPDVRTISVVLYGKNWCWQLFKD